MSRLPVRLLRAHARYLEEVRRRYDLAERFYLRAIAADPNDPRSLGSYAAFLETVREEHEQAEFFYVRALAADRPGASLLGNYADFLEHARRDHDRAEEYYRKALSTDPEHVNNLTNFATFLTEIRGEHEKAESLYRLALTIDPYHRNALFKYAIFLTDIREAYGEAESLYRKGLIVAPHNAAMQANLAGLLLMKGNRVEGEAALRQALQHPVLNRPVPDALECWFYMFVYLQQQGALYEIKRMVQLGVRSPGWNLAPHIERAVQSGHSDSEWLVRLAAVIVGREPVEALEEWDDWQSL